MSSNWINLSAIAFVFTLTTGCGSGRPDPRENPEFNEAAMSDPLSAKMHSESSKSAPKKK